MPDNAVKLNIGDVAPTFTLPDQDGKPVSLSDFSGTKVIVYFYPAAMTPGCTTEACDFRDHYADLLSSGASAVFGLSSQDTEYQREVVERLRLPFEILSDPQLSLVDALALPTFQAAGLTLFKRLTLVIADGVIEHVFYPIFPPNEHAQEVLAWLRSNA